MQLLLVVMASAAVLWLAYRFYGSLLVRLLRLREQAPMPSQTMRDDVDYVPTEPKFLMSQHFSAIAAAGPIVGPIQAGLFFGWLPALLWILLGSIFIGGVHDLTALVASVRHKARSIAQIVREHMSRRSYVLFLLFIWIALVYIIVAFTDIVATSFVGTQTLEDGTVFRGGATATSSLLYLALPVAMGLLLRYTRLSINWATILFLPLVAGAIMAGPYLPLDLGATLNVSDAAAVKIWDVLLLGYCLVAGAVPVWLLLQPRGHLGGCFLLVALLGATAGILVGGVSSLLGWSDFGHIRYGSFLGWEAAGLGSLAPMLFITVACGACSGFHCLIASGTTSKQLRQETDAKFVGYGAMLLEGMVAVVSLGCVMVLTTEAVKGKGPNIVYAAGNGQFLGALGIPMSFAVPFALLAFTTFVYDTLDVCTRLGRYIVQELTGLQGSLGKWLGTGLTATVPLLFVTQTSVNQAGAPIPAWRVFWPLFGASNQLLAALALVGVTVWLWRTYRAWWVWPVVGLPTVLMYTMSMWALLTFIRDGFWDKQGAWKSDLPSSPVPWAAAVLVALSVLVLIEALRAFARGGAAPSDGAAVDQPAPAV